MKARLHRKSNFVLICLHIIGEWYVLADQILLHTEAIDAEFELLVLGISPIEHPDGIPDGHPGNDVIPVRGKIVASQKSAACAERKTVDGVFLRVILTCIVSFAARDKLMS